jgi:cation diffusion facilitator CzcD-associated flavoprotein CzcO
MSDQVLPYLVLGAGPGGLQLAYFLELVGHDHLVLDRGAGGGSFFERFPRHRKLISSNKIHTGYNEPERQMRFDWNSLLTQDYSLLFRDYSRRYFAGADDMVRYLRDFSDKYVPRARYGVDVNRISREGDVFVVRDAAGETWRAARLVVATGNSRPYVPEIPGIDLADLYTNVDTHPDNFINQRVLIIGKGNSGFETGENLLETAERPLAPRPASPPAAETESRRRLGDHPRHQRQRMRQARKQGLEIAAIGHLHR